MKFLRKKTFAKVIRIGKKSRGLVLFEMNIWNKTQYEWQKVWVASFIFWSLNFLKPGYPIWPYLWFCPRLCVTTVYHRVIISDIKFYVSESLWPFFGVLLIVFSSHKFSSIIKFSKKKLYDLFIVKFSKNNILRFLFIYSERIRDTDSSKNTSCPLYVRTVPSRL